MLKQWYFVIRLHNKIITNCFFEIITSFLRYFSH